MRSILTSYLGGASRVGEKRVPGVLFEANGLLKKIQEFWPKNARVLMICASPDDYEKNDAVVSCYRQSLSMSELSYSSLEMCDDRNEASADMLGEKDVIILTGGHVPTQNAFFKKIGLKEKLQDFDGLLLAWSAGSMNCAETVYAGPELPGESIDPDYQRWISGLGITNINIWPHFQHLREEMLDGRRLLEDITYEDSMGHEFIALNDGSYVLIEGGKETIFGEAYSIKNARLELICRDGDHLAF